MSDRCTSDLTDAQWNLIRQYLPTEQDGPGRPMELELREIVNAILYVLRTGCQWDNLPTDLPNSNSVYYHYRKRQVDGTWRQVNRALRKEKRTDRDRDPEPTGAIIDMRSSTAKALRPQNRVNSTGGERGYDAGKGVWGRKRHVIVDTAQDVLDVVVHAADIQGCRHSRLPTFKIETVPDCF
jgi:putative transposase